MSVVKGLALYLGGCAAIVLIGLWLVDRWYQQRPFIPSWLRARLRSWSRRRLSRRTQARANLPRAEVRRG